MFERIKFLLKKYERWISPITVVSGFVFDNLTLKRIDVLYSNALLLSYLVISAVSILILNIHEHRRKDSKGGEDMRSIILVFIMQFCFGGILGGAFLFYSKSGTLVGSWPFLLMLIGYIAANEFLRKNYIRLGFQVAVFFTALFSYLIFFVPIILGRMGDEIFLLSGLASLMITGFFIYILSWFAPGRTKKSAPIIAGSLLGLFTIINVLYFTNLIPPIPLALKNAGIYRSVERLDSDSYVAIGEKQKWFSLLHSKPEIHMLPGEPLYALSLIFAPTNLETNIVHVWQYYDRERRIWVEFKPISLYISGGRDNGFRTYSIKQNVFPGLWRVDVRTPRGQIIGRLTFNLVVSKGNEEIISVVK